MALSYRLTTLERLKTALGLPASTSDDPKLDALVDAATVAIENYCDNGFVTRSYSEYSRAGINGHQGGARRIFLRRYPIQSVASITEAPSGTIPATDYLIYGDEGYLEHVSYWPAPDDRWTIAYTAGRFASTTAVDEALRLACHMLVEDWKRKPDGPVSSTSSAQRSQSFTEADMPQRVKLVLEPYRSRL